MRLLGSSLKEDLVGIQMVLRTVPWGWIWLGLCVILVVIYAVLTDAFLLSEGILNPLLDKITFFLVLLLAILVSLVLVLFGYRWKTFHSVSGKAGWLGSFLGLFASSCSVCQPIWLLWLGLGSASAFLVQYNAWIALVSVLLVLWSLHSASQAVFHKTCALQSVGAQSS